MSTETRRCAFDTPLQFAETGLFLVLTLALAGLCFYRLDRRLT
jgi:hypothetical protein